MCCVVSNSSVGMCSSNSISGRQVAALEVAGVVDEHGRVTDLVSDAPGTRPRSSPPNTRSSSTIRRLAALAPDRLLQAGGVRGLAGGQDDEEPLGGEALGDGAADAPADADR